MNNNDMNRYYWRTGHRWPGDYRSQTELRGPTPMFSRWTAILLFGCFIATTVALFVYR